MTQRRSRGIDARTGDFQRRYEPNFAWKSLAASISCIPGLRVAYTMAAFDSNGDVFGTSTFGAGAVLSYNGDPDFGIDGLAPYLELDGTGDYLHRNDEANLDITAQEPYVYVAYQGLTMGTWVYPQAVDSLQAIIGKWNTNGVDQRSYLIDLTAGNVFRASVSSLGTAATVSTVSSTVTVSEDQWYYVNMAFSPSGGAGDRLAINVNGTITATNTVIGSIFSSSANFVVGAQDNGASNLLTGRLGAGWLAAMYHENLTTPTDHFSQTLFQHTRALYGV